MSGPDIKLDRPRYKDYPDFTPDLSPKAMARAGVFDGAYFEDDIDDPSDIDEEILKTQRGPSDPKKNAFGVHSGLSREKWDERGWLSADNPRGWYEWFCRFDSGKRFDEDEEQIRRWQNFKKRWSPKSLEALENMNPKEGTRQALLHWALDPQTPERSASENEKDSK